MTILLSPVGGEGTPKFQRKQGWCQNRVLTPHRMGVMRLLTGIVALLMLPAVGWGQPPELPDSDVTALTGNIFVTLTGSYPYDLVSQTRVRKDLMEKKTGFLGIPSSAWVVIGILALMGGGAIVTCALVALAFGVSIG